jgi:hypothetical protein
VRRLLVAFVAVVATLAFASVAYAQDGAEPVSCSDLLPGLVGVEVVTPNGFLNANCTFAGPKRGGGATIFPCSEIEAGTGNVILTPSAHFKTHCTVEASSEPGSP